MVLIFRKVFAIAALLMLIFLTACGTIEVSPDPERQDRENAVLEGYSRYLFLYIEQLGISSVDGKRATGLLGHVGLVSLPPGVHWVEFQVDRNYGPVARCAFELKFDAQHHYQIKTLKVDGLLAHPLFSPYKGLIQIEVAALGKTAQTLNFAVECTGFEHLCRQDSDCSPNFSCRTERGFDFGACIPRNGQPAIPPDAAR